MNQQISDYISQARGQGMSDEQIRSDLLSAGWDESQVTEVLPTTAVLSISPITGRRLSKKMLIITVVVSVFVLAGGVFGYFYYFNSSPELVLANMFSKLAEVKSLEL